MSPLEVDAARAVQLDCADATSPQAVPQPCTDFPNRCGEALGAARPARPMAVGGQSAETSSGSTAPVQAAHRRPSAESPLCTLRCHVSREQPGHWSIEVCDARGKTLLQAEDFEPGLCGEPLELLAVIRGLEALDGASRVTLLGSVRYVRQGLRFGLPHWRRNGWRWERFGRMVPVRHEDLWRRLDRALQFHQVEFRRWRLDSAHPRCPSPSFSGGRPIDWGVRGDLAGPLECNDRTPTTPGPEQQQPAHPLGLARLIGRLRDGLRAASGRPSSATQTAAAGRKAANAVEGSPFAEGSAGPDVGWAALIAGWPRRMLTAARSFLRRAVGGEGASSRATRSSVAMSLR